MASYPLWETLSRNLSGPVFPHMKNKGQVNPDLAWCVVNLEEGISLLALLLCRYFRVHPAGVCLPVTVWGPGILGALFQVLPVIIVFYLGI